ncbi:hypothetical protein GIB67_002895 [Kingdonia uniflora]|uniref:F-actin-capping protein subunit beta n=1 Tax=Kingdonia uniflora TaxID=39325 RepID=A0A7J7P527_9MAGN|nr:hypothetical protein GIB67_002895 [Kingdonia uniflora]
MLTLIGHLGQTISPLLEDVSYPSVELRNLEIEANDVFAIYRDQYYEGVIVDDEWFEDGQGRRGTCKKVGQEEEGMAPYCLTSTIMLSLTTNDESSGTFSLS